VVFGSSSATMIFSDMVPPFPQFRSGLSRQILPGKI
jgi:hypothetical protein